MTKSSTRLLLIISLLIFSGKFAMAQINDASSSLLKVSAGDKAVFCAANANFKLTASTDDGNGNSFAAYEWYTVDANGGADLIASETAATLVRSGETPGYHTYRVYGIQNLSGGATCKSDAFEDFTVYVLPDLNVTATVPAATGLSYCLNNIPPANDPRAIVLTAAAAFAQTPNKVGGLTDLQVGDFGLNYQWYKVDASNQRTLVGSNQDTYTVTDNIDGTFTYQVDVSYKLKSTCGPYNATATQNGSAAKIVVTKVPGKPTITIQ